MDFALNAGPDDAKDPEWVEIEVTAGKTAAPISEMIALSRRNPLGIALLLGVFDDAYAQVTDMLAKKKIKHAPKGRNVRSKRPNDSHLILDGSLVAAGGIKTYLDKQRRFVNKSGNRYSIQQLVIADVLRLKNEDLLAPKRIAGITDKAIREQIWTLSQKISNVLDGNYDNLSQPLREALENEGVNIPPSPAGWTFNDGTQALNKTLQAISKLQTAPAPQQATKLKLTDLVDQDEVRGLRQDLRGKAIKDFTPEDLARLAANDKGYSRISQLELFGRLNEIDPAKLQHYTGKIKLKPDTQLTARQQIERRQRQFRKEQQAVAAVLHKRHMKRAVKPTTAYLGVPRQARKEDYKKLQRADMHESRLDTTLDTRTKRSPHQSGHDDNFIPGYHDRRVGRAFSEYV